MRSIVHSLRSIFLSCTHIMEKIMSKVLGGCGEAFKVLSIVLGLLMSIGVAVSCAIFLIPIETLKLAGETLSPSSSEVIQA